MTPRGGHCCQALTQTGEGTPAVLQDSGTTRDEAVYRFSAPTDWHKKERQGSRPTVGEAPAASLGGYRPPQAGQPPPSKVPPHHCLPALLGM